MVSKESFHFISLFAIGISIQTFNNKRAGNIPARLLSIKSLILYSDYPDYLLNN
jgi:hypothetical protein